MKSEEQIKERLGKFLKDNPKDWVYGTNNPTLQALYQATIEQLEWVLEP